MEEITYLIKNGHIDTKIKNIDLSTLHNGFSLDIYKAYIEQGYSVIRLDHNNILDIIINKNISIEQDGIAIMNICHSILDNCSRLHFINLVNIREDDYDFMYFISKNLRKLLPSLTCLLHEKLHTLTKKEQEVMNEYRHFSLENLLCNDKLLQNVISNHNCGVIAIYPNQMIAKTNTKNSHDIELSWIDKKINNQGNNKIEIRILSYGLIITLPMDNLTDYQLACLEELMDEISLLIKKYQINKTLNTGIISIYGIDIITTGRLDDRNISKFKQYIANMRKRGDHIYGKCKLSN